MASETDYTRCARALNASYSTEEATLGSGLVRAIYNQETRKIVEVVSILTAAMITSEP